jgi:membrane dipeptidase
MGIARQTRRGFLGTAAGAVGATGLLPGMAAPASAAASAAAPRDLSDLVSPTVKDYIERGRQEFLREMKPTKAQIERGLELHRNTIVCDLHGQVHTTHHAGLYSDRMKQYALDRLSQEKGPDRRRKLVGTIGQELQKWRALEIVSDPTVQANHRALWEAGAVDVGVDIVPWAPEGGDDQFCLEQIARGTYIYDNYDHLHKLVRAEHIPEVKRQGKHAVLWHCDRPDACFAGPHVKDSVKNIGLFHGFGIRATQLTNSTKNQIGYSHYQEADRGLTDVGQAVVKRMNELGMMIDLAHCGYRTTLDTIKTSDDPVTITHTACRTLAEGGKSKYRNVTDEALKAIANKGGMVGIIKVPNLLGGMGLEHFYKHIDYVVKLVGADYVGIGSDNGGMSVAYEPPKLTAARKPARFLPSGLKGTAAYWRYDVEPTSWSWTNGPYFTVGLVCQGYSDDQIRKIIGGNFLRVASAVLDKSPRGILM